MHIVTEQEMVLEKKSGTERMYRSFHWPDVSLKPRPFPWPGPKHPSTICSHEFWAALTPSLGTFAPLFLALDPISGQAMSWEPLSDMAQGSSPCHATAWMGSSPELF